MNFLVDERLNEKQLRRLKDHVYSSSGKSILDNKLNPFWNYVVEKLPLWLAPNLIQGSAAGAIDLIKSANIMEI